MSDARIPWPELVELLRDAARCHRLSEWEIGFVTGLQMRLGPIYPSGEPKFETHFTDRQHAVLRRIREKVHAV